MQLDSTSTIIPKVQKFLNLPNELSKIQAKRKYTKKIFPGHKDVLPQRKFKPSLEYLVISRAKEFSNPEDPRKLRVPTFSAIDFIISRRQNSYLHKKSKVFGVNLDIEV